MQWDPISLISVRLVGCAGRCLCRGSWFSERRPGPAADTRPLVQTQRVFTRRRNSIPLLFTSLRERRRPIVLSRPVQMSHASRGLRMPAEWEPHERTWMCWPRVNPTFMVEKLPDVYAAWAAVANAIAKYEPVTLVADLGDTESARSYLSPDIKVIEMPIDDAWARDTAPTFVLDGVGKVAAVDWIFNGWGAQSWAVWEKDATLASRIAHVAGVPGLPSNLVNEGGGIHVDGEGTVLLTETVQLDPCRNPGLSKEDVEREIHAMLGTTKAIWLPRGLSRDYEEFGTRGHIDIIACFVRPGVVLAHSQTNPEHPDHEVTKSLIAALRSSTDAQGRQLKVIELPAPQRIRDDEGNLVDFSYVNHYVLNGAVILCAFQDPNDQVAAAILQECYPDRTIELVDAREIFAHGGGIHCITQQQPRASVGAS